VASAGGAGTLPPMMVSHEARVLFVHVQKTGGSTIDSMLQAVLPDVAYVRDLPQGRHAQLGPALRQHPELADYWIFGFVRNPWARLLSWHSMIKRNERYVAEGNAKAAERLAGNRLWRLVQERYPDFESFVMEGLDRQGQLNSPQIAYLRTKQRTADFIGRQESFEADLRTVLDRLGAEWPTEIPRLNSGTPTDYRERYTDAMRDKVAEVFARDLKRFGYEF